MGSVYSVVRVLRLAEHRLELTSTEAATPLGTPERAGCDKPVVALTWSPCSRFLIVAHENGRVVVWDVVAAVPLCDAYALVEDGAGAVDLTVLRAWRERVACEAQPAELTGADLDAGAEAARHVRCRAFASPAAGMRSHAHSSSSCGSVVSAVGSAGECKEILLFCILIFLLLDYSLTCWTNVNKYTILYSCVHFWGALVAAGLSPQAASRAPRLTSAQASAATATRQRSWLDPDNARCSCPRNTGRRDGGELCVCVCVRFLNCFRKNSHHTRTVHTSALDSDFSMYHSTYHIRARLAYMLVLAHRRRCGENMDS